MAGEAGPEEVNVTPLSGGGAHNRTNVVANSMVARGGNKGGVSRGQPIIVQVMLNGREIAEAAAKDIDDDISGFRP